MMHTFGERLKQLREERNLTQEDLAKIIHVPRATLANWEIDRADPGIKMAQYLADFFKASTDYLLGRSDNPGPSDEIISAIQTPIEFPLGDDPSAKELLSFWKELKQRSNLFLLFRQIWALSDESVRRLSRVIRAIEEEEEQEFDG
jgi:transcriptional regulator with XRE-family HTH domain